MQALAGDDLPLTQEFLAQMMGVRRTSVSAIAQELQRSGLIEYHRGKIRIKDRESIRQASCECHQDLAEHYNLIAGRAS
ncbi:Crp/Fnr family transcriptional regulator [Tardiphaga sp.]|uniref:Crp/Fnr family transcriptional regulator n=1 Tax=Tardiphaga sp. TaxID=1926292 RepID=UPI0037D9A3B0